MSLFNEYINKQDPDVSNTGWVPVKVVLTKAFSLGMDTATCLKPRVRQPLSFLWAAGGVSGPPAHHSQHLFIHDHLPSLAN